MIHMWGKVEPQVNCSILKHSRQCNEVRRACTHFTSAQNETFSINLTTCVQTHTWKRLNNWWKTRKTVSIILFKPLGRKQTRYFMSGSCFFPTWSISMQIQPKPQQIIMILSNDSKVCMERHKTQTNNTLKNKVGESASWPWLTRKPWSSAVVLQ